MSDARRTVEPQAAGGVHCVSSAEYFLGAVGLVNSLRLAGHREPIHILDCGLSPSQRKLLAATAELVDAPPGRAPFMLKPVLPLADPAAAMVLIDTDMIVTRSLAPLIERASDGRVVAFRNHAQRHEPGWGPLLGLGPIRRQPYVCSGLVATPARPASRCSACSRTSTTASISSARASASTTPSIRCSTPTRTCSTRSSRAGSMPSASIALEHRLSPMIPFAGVEVIDVDAVRCAYADGTEPYVLHHSMSPKPWQRTAYEGVYSRLLRRLLTGPGLAVRVPEAEIPLGLREGPLAYAERQRVKGREQLRWRLGGLAGGSAPRRCGGNAASDSGDRPAAAFYCVADERYFLGAVGLINSLRLVGHDEPIYLLDCGLTRCAARAARAAGDPDSRPGRATPPWLLKTVAPLERPGRVVALLDTDMVVTRSLAPLLERARPPAGSSRFENPIDRHSRRMGRAARPRRRRAAALRQLCVDLRRVASLRRGPRADEERQRRIDFELTYWRRNVPGYPFTYADQDVFNAIIQTKLEPEQVEAARPATRPDAALRRPAA